MRKILISLVIGVRGNINADDSIGNRITIKKFLTSDGKILPFVSARAIRRGIRDRLLEKGYNVDPLFVDGEGSKAKLYDMGNPVEYIDDDIFGYLAIKKKGKKEEGAGIPRVSPIKFSYLIAMDHSEVTVERGGRFPRPHTEKKAFPTPFEVEVSNFTGLLNVLVEDRIGVFKENELKEEIIEKHKDELSKGSDGSFKLSKNVREERLRVFLEILLKEGWVFPRATTSLNTIEYRYGVIAFSEKLVPLGGLISLDGEKLNTERLLAGLKVLNHPYDKLYVIDYTSGKIFEVNGSGGLAESNLENVDSLIGEAVEYLIR